MESTNPQQSRPGARSRLAVVSGYALNSMSPRGQRTHYLTEELGSRWDTELVALPAETFERASAPVVSRPLWRRAAWSAVNSILLDRWELWSARRFRRWRPQADAALMICSPWSPAAYAARRLAAAGIPYVVDAGDPWAFTEVAELPRTLGIWRARRAEQALWRGAVGAVVTTPQQGRRLARAFPHLRILVRPNGFVPTPTPPALAADWEGRDRTSLRLAHFGTLSEVRIGVESLLAGLQRSQRWKSITFAQFGDDYAGMLKRVPKGVQVERHPPRPWSEVVAGAADFDAAIVLGNQLGYLLPSKAVQYLTLPVPRIALVGSRSDDALADYAAEHPGWLVVTPDEEGVGERVWEHVGTDWPAGELAPPPAEAWPAVAEQIAGFIEGCVCRSVEAAVA
jgi:hypothetical protein